MLFNVKKVVQNSKYQNQKLRVNEKMQDGNKFNNIQNLIPKKFPFPVNF